MLCFIQSKMVHQCAIACKTAMSVSVWPEQGKTQDSNRGEDDPGIELRLPLKCPDAGEDVHKDGGDQHHHKNREVPSNAHHQDGEGYGRDGGKKDDHGIF